MSLNPLLGYVSALEVALVRKYQNDWDQRRSPRLPGPCTQIHSPTPTRQSPQTTMKMLWAESSLPRMLEVRSASDLRVLDFVFVLFGGWEVVVGFYNISTHTEY